MFCGIPTMAAVSIYSVEGLAGLGGRLLFGVAADRFGVKRVIVAGLLAPGARHPGLPRRPRDRRLLPARHRLRHGLRRRDAALRRARPRVLQPVDHGHRPRRRHHALLHRHGLGPLGGGWIYDTFGNYAWLYIGSAGLAAARRRHRARLPARPRERPAPQPTLPPAVAAPSAGGRPAGSSARSRCRNASCRDRSSGASTERNALDPAQATRSQRHFADADERLRL